MSRQRSLHARVDDAEETVERLKQENWELKQAAGNSRDWELRIETGIVDIKDADEQVCYQC